MYKGDVVDAYLDVLGKEISAICGKYHFDTLYIGGGTPTVLNENQLKKLLSLINRYVDCGNLAEFTVEANPGTLNQEKVDILRENFVNRISLGVQSFNEKYLKTLGRIHSGQHVVQTYSMLRKSGFDNISVDLIFGLPSQEVEDWKNDLDFAVSLHPEHISTYSLSYEDGTVFSDLVSQGILHKVDESNVLEMYKLTIESLVNSCYEHYEISNFAKKDKHSFHNSVYWKNKGYIGIGAGACSFVCGRRFSNEPNVLKYIQNVNKCRSNAVFYERLSSIENAAETLIMGLRMRSGISTNSFFRQTGYVLSDIFNDQISELTRTGYLCFNDDRLAFTKKGLYVADSVMMEFLN